MGITLDRLSLQRLQSSHHTLHSTSVLVHIVRNHKAQFGLGARRNVGNQSSDDAAVTIDNHMSCKPKIVNGITQFFIVHTQSPQV